MMLRYICSTPTSRSRELSAAGPLWQLSAQFRESMIGYTPVLKLKSVTGGCSGAGSYS